MMRRAIVYVLCTAGMLGVFWAVRFAIYGVSDGFGDGFFVGVATMAFLFWVADRAQKSRY